MSILHRQAAHENLLNDWRSARYPDKAEGFAKDGPIHWPAFADATPKILFVLKDPSTKEFMESEYGGDLGLWAQRKVAIGSTWLNLARWAWSLVAEPEADLRGEMSRSTAALYLEKIAVVNLKKSPFNASKKTNTTADRLMVNAYARRDQDLLRQQIGLIDPDVIIGCGVQCPLIWLLGLTPQEVANVAVGKQEGRQVHLVRGGADGPMVILTRHPGRAPVNPKGGMSVGEELRGLMEPRPPHALGVI